MYMNERKSGTNHVTAALAAEANAAPMGRVSVVYEYKDMFKLSCTPTTGDIYVSSGALIWNGRHCGVVNTENVKYTPLESDTLYKQIIVAAQYRKDASSGVETVSLVALESEIVESQSAAMNLTMNTGSAEIGEATTLANFPLWRFVATATTHTEPVQLFDVQKNYKTLMKNIMDSQRNIDNETKERKEETKALTAAVNGISKGIYEIVTGISAYTSFYSNDKIKRGDYFAYLLKFSNDETMIIPSVPGGYKKYFYKVEEISLNPANKVTEMYRGVTLTTLSELYITFSGTNADNCPYVTEIYGIR